MCSVTEIGVSKYRQLTIIIIFKIFSMIKFKHRRFNLFEVWNVNKHILILLTSTKNSCAFLFKATQTWNFVYEFQ